MPDFDLVVIGAGAAGLSAASLSAALGLKVALIERGAMGGDCLNYGCVPSKALLAAAHAAAAVRRAGAFGVRVGEPAIDWAAMRAHVQGSIARIAPTDSAERFRGMGIEVIRAAAHFAAPDVVEAAGRRLSFRRCVIAAGSAAVVPDIPGLGPVPWLTNETIFDLEAPPGHLVILGGGPIGLEMAQAHARLGVRVSVIEAGSIAGRDDPELVEGLRRALRRDGVALHEGVAVRSFAPTDQGLVARLADGSAIEGTHLLLATGRAARVAGLDLQAGNVAFTARGITTDAALRSTTNRRVFAAGDIADPVGIGPRAFTHVCSQHAGILARAMLLRLPAKLDYAALPRVTYTDPELAQIGMTEAEARAAGHQVRLLRFPLAETDRAVTEGLHDGLVKLVATPSGRLLGAGILAPGAGEMAGLFTLMIARRMKLSALAGLVLPYPTLAEAAKRAAGDFYAPKLLSPVVKRVVGLLKRLP
jgi:pyruvate/2-oxoglutarate dehydrogenase complex dihydrolipoamide dehydrogenase (E3) component